MNDFFFLEDGVPEMVQRIRMGGIVALARLLISPFLATEKTEEGQEQWLGAMMVWEVG